MTPAWSQGWFASYLGLVGSARRLAHNQTVHKLLVDPSAVDEASLRLGVVADGIREFHRRLGNHAGVATGTPAAAAMDDLLDHYSRVLPHFADAGTQLSRAVAAAAGHYHHTESRIAAAASGDADAS